MARLKLKNCNMILIEKLRKYQPCHEEKLTSMNILLVKKYCLLIKKNKFIYFPLGKAFEKQTKTIEYQGEKQVRAIKDNKK